MILYKHVCTHAHPQTCTRIHPYTHALIHRKTERQRSVGRKQIARHSGADRIFPAFLVLEMQWLSRQNPSYNHSFLFQEMDDRSRRGPLPRPQPGIPLAFPRARCRTLPCACRPGSPSPQPRRGRQPCARTLSRIIRWGWTGPWAGAGA